MADQTRRQWLGTAIGTTATVPLLAGCMGSSDDEDEDSMQDDSTAEADNGVTTGDGTWPMADFDAANTRVVEEWDGPEGPVEERWAVEMDDDLSEPVVAHDLVYVMEAGATLYAFDLATGDIEWEHDRDDHDRTATPAVTDDAVYFLTDELEALDPQTGDRQWAIELPGSSSGGQIRVFDGMVYVAAGGYVSAIDASAESMIWSEAVDNHVAMAIDEEGDVYIVREGWYWESYNGESGTLKWDEESDVELTGGHVGIAVYDDTVYSMVNDEVWSFDVESGGKEIALELRDYPLPGRPVIWDGIAFGTVDGTVNYTDALLAFDMETGDELEEFGAKSSRQHNPAVIGDTLYVLEGWSGATDKFAAIEIETTEYKWEYDRGELVDGLINAAGYAVLKKSIVYTSDHANHREVAVFETK